MLMASSRKAALTGAWQTGWPRLQRLVKARTKTRVRIMAMADTTVSHKIPEPVPAVARRILVLLDGSRLSLAAMEAAADIARAQQAEVLGIFVEEANLLRSAGYGFAREVSR